MRRLGKFEWKIIVALVVTAAAPLAFTWFMIDRLVEESMAVGLNDRVLGSLRSGVDLYKEVIESRIRIVRLQSKQLSEDPVFGQALKEGDRAKVQTALEDLVDGASWISQIQILKGETVQYQARSAANFGETKWKSKVDLFDLSEDQKLEVSFVISRKFLEASSDLRELVLTLESLLEDFHPWKMGYYKAFLFIYIWILLAAIILGYVLSRSVTKRVSKVVEATRHAAQGDLGVRVENSSSDEIGVLSESFNQMMNDIQSGRDRIVYLEKVSSWQEIARRLAHEIKNPLTPIQLSVQELHRSYKGDDGQFSSKLDDSLEIVEEEVATLRRLVETFSDFAKMPTVQTELQDLGVFVSEFLKLHPQYSDRVSFSPAAEEVPVQMDRILMGRVLANLIDNGLEASDEGGQVELMIRCADNWASLFVRDHGSGLTDEVRQRLFQPYFTSKAEGTGLGLAIVKKIVLQHGGEISVADGEGDGTVFTLRLRLDEGMNTVDLSGGS